MHCTEYVVNMQKFYTAGVMGVQGFWQSTGPIIGIREPTPLKLVPNKRLDIVFVLYTSTFKR